MKHTTSTPDEERPYLLGMCLKLGEGGVSGTCMTGLNVGVTLTERGIIPLPRTQVPLSEWFLVCKTLSCVYLALGHTWP